MVNDELMESYSLYSIIIFYAAANGLYEYYLTGDISYGRSNREIDGPLAALLHLCALVAAPIGCRNALRMIFPSKERPE
jgi:hypothetical protein